MRFLAIAFMLFAPTAFAKSVAIVPFDDLARQLDPAFRSSFAKIEGVRMMSAPQTAAEVEAAQRTGLNCSAADDACLAKMATLMKVDMLISLTARPMANGASAELIAIDAAQARRSGNITMVLAPEETVDKFDDVAVRLLAPTATMGTLLFDVKPIGAHIRVDNGAAMSAPQIRLRAGKHTVEISREGFETQTETVEVRPAMTTTLRATLVPAPVVEYVPPGPKQTTGVGSGLFVAGAAVTGAGFVGVVGGGVAAFILDGILHTPQGNATQREQMLFWEKFSAGVGAGAAVLVLAGGVMLLIAE